MTARRRAVRRHRVPRLPLRLHRRGRLRDLRARRRRGRALPSALLADAGVKPIGLGARDSLRLEAGPLPLRPRHRRRRPRRSRPASPGRSRSAAARRAASPAPSASSASSPTAPTRMRVGIQPEGRAPAREGADDHDADGRRDRRRHLRRLRPDRRRPGRHGLCRRALRRAGHRLSARSCAARPLPAKVAPCRSSPHRYHRAEQLQEENPT